ncbi:MAG: TetR/AcrR family transcriptional regulator [Ilumatobacteraceae bacterium]
MVTEDTPPGRAIVVPERRAGRAVDAAEARILDAARSLGERWGFGKVTVDDIAVEAGVSRATLYRLFPGGRDVLFDALRVRHLEEFFSRLSDELEGLDTLDDFLVGAVVAATIELRDDRHLAAMLATEPGAALGQLTVDGLPRIIRMATAFLAPLVERFLPRADGARLVDVVARLVISYFLAPSDHIDLADPESARAFLTSSVLPALVPSIRS